MEYLSSSHNLAFSDQKSINLMRACTNSIIEVCSGFIKKLTETTDQKARRRFGDFLSLIIQTYQTNLKISQFWVTFFSSRGTKHTELQPRKT